jgi:AraC family transcriptional regulator
MKYDERIQRSVEYIDGHLAETLDLEKVASESGYSLSHFYKVFPAITGFSIKEFVRNKRLAVAARRLVTTPNRILDIALDCGFESQEVFTRAFQTLYGLTPGNYRRERVSSVKDLSAMDAFARLMEERGQRPLLDIPVRIEIIRRDWIHLVGMEIRTSVAENIEELVIPRFWQQTFVPRIKEIPNLAAGNTAIAYEVTDPRDDSLLHMACFEVSVPKPPVGMVARSLEPGYYAAFTPSRFLDPWEYTALVRYAYGEWFPMSGCEIRADFTMDLYIDLPSRDGRSVVQQMTVLVPIHAPTNKKMAARFNLYPPATAK